MYPGTRSNPIVIEGRTQATTSLLSKVLFLTSLAFFVTGVGVALAPALYSSGLLLICFIASFALIFGIRAARKTPALAFGLFMLLALVMGIEIAPWIISLLHMGAGGISIVFNAALTTAVGMASIGIAAQIVSFNYRRVANYAFAALLGLVLIGILGMFFHFVNPTLYSWASLAIFSVLLLVDFMRIKNGGDGATATELAVSIYLDGLNIFLALTQIFSGGSRRR
jgi:FtsH-binding integral membrane protein